MPGSIGGRSEQRLKYHQVRRTTPSGAFTACRRLGEFSTIASDALGQRGTIKKLGKNALMLLPIN